MDKVAKKKNTKRKKLFETLESDQNQADAGGDLTLEKENCILL